MAIKIRGKKALHVQGTKSNTQPRSDLVKRRIDNAHQKHYESKNDIIMKDWAGNILYQGNCDSSQVDRVLKANRCVLCGDMRKEQEKEECPRCDGTGYTGDFSVYWLDESDTRNVYEYINY